MEHVNFYENYDEAVMRLNNTVVLYDGEPYFVLCIVPHPDGIFRLYLDPLQDLVHRRVSVPYDWFDEPGMSKAQKMEKFVKDNPDTGIIRKTINSPAFGKFRPFPLGMYNTGHSALYIERSPTRATQQGLSANMMSISAVSLEPETSGSHKAAPRDVEYNVHLYNCIKGVYPAFSDCRANLLDPSISNSSVAFSRQFALIRGPVNSLFLAYKSSVVGFLPDPESSKIYIGTEYKHLLETIEETGLFSSISIR